MAKVAAEVGSTANKYEILAKLATGGTADIFLARRPAIAPTTSSLPPTIPIAWSAAGVRSS